MKHRISIRRRRSKRQRVEEREKERGCPKRNVLLLNRTPLQVEQEFEGADLGLSLQKQIGRSFCRRGYVLRRPG